LQILREDGIEVLLNAKAKRASGGAGSVQLTAESQGKTAEIKGSHMLVATGRIPNTDTLNVQAAGIATDAKGCIRTNEKLETNVESVYGLGDIKGGPAFTHISYDDFRIVRTNLIEKGSTTIAGRILPYTVFIDPQLGRVGMTEARARQLGHDVRVARMPMNYVARALEMDESRGFMKAIVDGNSGQILGAAVLGIEGGEIMSQVQIAMMGKLPYTALRDGIFAHPTLAESLNNLFGHLE
jgi:pyruvate/2-oxoglutarate dehydrogenase complex dihydrolipoamide dehydrogenase (E3) component